jgi:hypothetical protein
VDSLTTSMVDTGHIDDDRSSIAVAEPWTDPLRLASTRTATSSIKPLGAIAVNGLARGPTLVSVHEKQSVYRTPNFRAIGLSIFLLPFLVIVSLVTDICMHEIISLCEVQSAGCHSSRNEHFDKFSCPRKRQKAEAVYFFLIVLSFDLIIYVEEIDLAEHFRACSTETRLLESSGVRWLSWVLVFLGLILMVEYFVWKAVKLCTVLMFLCVNAFVRIYFAIALREFYYCKTTSHDDGGNQNNDDITVEVPSMSTDGYIRLLIMIILFAVSLGCFCLDNIEVIRREHFWMVIDFFRLLWFEYVLVPTSSVYGFLTRTCGLSMTSQQSVRLTNPLSELDRSSSRF